MTKDWQELTRITRGAPLVVERIRLKEGDIVLEGSFDLPPLARLTMEDQIFVTAFIRSHGSIKDMEELFGISLDINPPASHSEILDQLDSGELSVEEAVEKLRG